jgi:hypothetical protein
MSESTMKCPSNVFTLNSQYCYIHIHSTMFWTYSCSFSIRSMTNSEYYLYGLSHQSRRAVYSYRALTTIPQNGLWYYRLWMVFVVWATSPELLNKNIPRHELDCLLWIHIQMGSNWTTKRKAGSRYPRHPSFFRRWEGKGKLWEGKKMAMKKEVQLSVQISTEVFSLSITVTSSQAWRQ